MATKGNRILLIAGELDSDKKALLYEKLDWDIGNDPEAHLSAAEIKSLSQCIVFERDRDVVKSLWSLVLRVPSNETLKNLCVKWLADYDNACRGYAMHYLRVRCPELIPSIFKKYQDDTDPGVRYGLAKHLQRLNTGKAIEMMIKALMKAQGEELEVLADELEITGDEQVLQRLRMLDEERGGGTAAAAVADRLEAKLKRKGRRSR